LTGSAERQRAIHSRDPDFVGVECPDCRGTDLEVVSLFGGAASEVLFRCKACLSCFNWVKWRGRLPPTATTS
jgi:hypothetical protein